MDTVQELLKDFDAGNCVSTLEMASTHRVPSWCCAPDYERAIQMAAIEMARVGQGFDQLSFGAADRLWDDASLAQAKTWDNLCTNVALDNNYQLTGDMYCAAKWLAWQWCTVGPRKFLERAKEHGHADRVILVSKDWPKGLEL